jgi:hypothetical protein
MSINSNWKIRALGRLAELGAGAESERSGQAFLRARIGELTEALRQQESRLESLLRLANGRPNAALSAEIDQARDAITETQLLIEGAHQQLADLEQSATAGKLYAKCRQALNDFGIN